MKQLIRKGNLVKYTDHYKNGKAYDVYAEVVYILDRNLKKTYGMELVTGLGDLNTRATIYVKPICNTKLHELDTVLLKEPNSEGLVSLDEHNIYLIDSEFEINKINEKIDFLTKKIEFYSKFHKLEYKLDFLLKNENI